MSKVMTLISKHAEWIFLSIIITSVYLIYFDYLGHMTVRMWDESRNAINAIEMLQNGNLLVTHYEGAPDMWNTKPPLLIWLITLFMKILGPTELALRLPSAISATLTAFLLFYFSKRYLKNIYIGLAAALVLASSMGYAESHIATSGDYDALLVLWITATSLLHFVYVQDADKNKKLIYPIAIILVLAVLTKGIAGMLFIPGIFLYTLWTKKLKAILLSSDFYKASVIFAVLIFAYYFGRELLNPGYIQAVIENEITGRYFEVTDSADYGFWFYLEHLHQFRYTPWIFILPFSATIIWLSKKNIIRQFSLFAFFYLVIFFLIISTSETKQVWYDAPLYPIAALLIGISLVELFKKITIRIKFNPSLKKVALTLFILSIAFLPLINTYDYLHRKDYSNLAPVIDYGKFLNSFTKKYPGKKEFSFMYEGYNAQMLFYAKAANYNGWKIKTISSADNLSSSEIVLGCDEQVKNTLQKKYPLAVIYSEKECQAYQVK